MNRLIAVIYTVFGLVAISCSQTDDGPDSPQHESEIDGREYVAEMPQVTHHGLSKAQETAVEQGTGFGLELFSAVAKNYSLCCNKADGNFTVSPLSANINLAMTANCLDKDARESIAAALGYADTADMDEVSRKLLAYFNTSAYTGMDINLVNSIWWKEQLKSSLNLEVVKHLGEFYFAPSFASDFTQDETVDKINKWVAENTRGKIPTLLEYFPEEVKSVINMVSVNALYFNGEWASPFDNTKTERAAFHGTSETKPVNMMHSTVIGSYGTSTDFEFATLDFTGSTAFTIVVPSGQNSAEQLSQGFQTSWWTDIILHGEPHKINLCMPKFKAETNLNMDAAMNAMGLSLAPSSWLTLFDSSERLGLANSKTIQNTAVTINEKGAEMAAATSTTVFTSGFETIDKTVNLIVDRPFLFFVWENTTNTILMAGRINNL